MSSRILTPDGFSVICIKQTGYPVFKNIVFGVVR